MNVIEITAEKKRHRKRSDWQPTAEYPVTAKTSFTPSPHRSDTTRTMREDILSISWLTSMRIKESPARASRSEMTSTSSCATASKVRST